MPPEDFQKLTRAIDGLTYPSESDEPFDLFVWDSEKSSARDALLDHIDSTRKVAQLSLAQFFSQLDDSDDAPRYRKLQAAIILLLADATVFRVGEGEVRVDVFIVGRDREGKWAGLHTVSVET